MRKTAGACEVISNLLRKGLPPLPARMQKLNVDKRGYPVPWFVQWINGEPNFQVVSPSAFRQAIRFGSCWICGERLGARKTFVMGPLNILNRVTSEPACHYDCARFAAQACPFLILPQAQYKEAPEGATRLAEVTSRNPGCCALWTTKTFKMQPAGEGRKLIVVSDPVAVDWYAQGKPASRATVLQSLDDGLNLVWAPLAAEPLRRARIDGLIAFEASYAKALQYLPSADNAMYADGF
jgi:hypothetical protein